MFQSTRPRGARRRLTWKTYTISLFQSTRPRGARRGWAGRPGVPGRVSIHAPARGATWNTGRLWESHRFQSTRPRGARRSLSPSHTKDSAFQSTRPRGARRPPPVPLRISVCFNPRARAGRDDSTRLKDPAFYVSIHAPARGATYSRDIIAGRPQFQSTRPRGARHQLFHRDSTRLKVSIHAPARGATAFFFLASRPVDQFQSTRPRGARLSLSLEWWRGFPCFNPRARAGRDALDARGNGQYLAGFNPRARAGRDPSRFRSRRRPHSFNPRARAGRDDYHVMDWVILKEFQSTRPRGARRFLYDEVYAFDPFQSTRPRGARRGAGIDISANCQVSIHAPARGATIPHDS